MMGNLAFLAKVVKNQLNPLMHPDISKTAPFESINSNIEEANTEENLIGENEKDDFLNIT